MKPSTDTKRYLPSCQSVFWRAVFRAEIDYLLQHVAAGEAILSVGCGPAIIESALSAHGCRITGLDVSAEALGPRTGRYQRRFQRPGHQKRTPVRKQHIAAPASFSALLPH